MKPVAVVAPVVALLAISGCGSSAQEPRPTPRDFAAKGGTVQTFAATALHHAGAPSSGEINQTLHILNERLQHSQDKRLFVRSPSRSRIALYCTACTPKEAEAPVLGLTRTGRVSFFDWEPNVLGPRCKAEPSDPAVTGGPSAGMPGAGTRGYYAAVALAARCSAHRASGAARRTTDLYLLDRGDKRVVAGPAATPAELFALVSSVTGKRHVRPQGGEAIAVVGPGITVIEAAYGKDRPDTLDTAQFYVLRDNAALSGADITDPQQNLDSATGGTGEPIVTFDFTASGRKSWQSVTRRIASRGQSNVLPGQDALSAFQHFAIALDRELVSVPYIDFERNPDGIDAGNGSQISGGFTVQSARNLAEILSIGPLPVRLLRLRIDEQQPSNGG
jgi:SecD/SecF fusion protein